MANASYSASDALRSRYFGKGKCVLALEKENKLVVTRLTTMFKYRNIMNETEKCPWFSIQQPNRWKL